MNLFKRLSQWITSPIEHVCSWEHRADPGEHEHGLNPCRRFCSCGRVQTAWLLTKSDTIEWRDVEPPGPRQDQAQVQEGH